MCADKEYKEAYLNRISITKKSRDWSNYALMAEQAAQWRKENPRTAYKIAKRAARIANKAPRPRQKGSGGPRGDELSVLMRGVWERMPLSKRKRHAMRARKNAIAQWLKRNPSDVEAVATKISNSLKEAYKENEEMALKNAAQLANARKNIDRSKQGNAASKGIKAWWSRLKEDPVAYEEYIERRKKTLLQTIKDESCL